MATSPLNADFDAIVEKALQEWHTPGLSISVVHNDQTWSKGYGSANLDNKTPMQPTTLSYAASTTKAHLCAAWEIYIRSEANQKKPETDRIKWSTPMSDIIREDFVLEDPVPTRDVTLEDAVSHRTGMPRHDCIYGGEGPSNVRDITRHLRHLPLHNKLRTEMEYCNLMYMAASHALETVTGKALKDVLREWIWEPLGMRQTYLSLGDAVGGSEEGAELMTGYCWDKLPTLPGYGDGKFVKQADMDVPEIAGAGAIFTTADDYAKWMRYLVTPGSKVLTDEMKKELWKPRSIENTEFDMSVPFDGDLLLYALGWFVCSYRGHKVYYHPGGMIGSGSLIMIVPELRWGMSFFGNTNPVGMTLRGVPFALLDEVIGVPDAEKGKAQAKVEEAVCKEFSKIAKAFEESKTKLYPAAPEKPTIPLSLAIEEYAGTYECTAYGKLHFSVVDKDGEEGTKILYALADKQAFALKIRLEHVNAELWLGERHIPDSSLKAAFKAESRIGVNGRVEKLGLAMESSMPETLIWFEKVKG